MKGLECGGEGGGQPNGMGGLSYTYYACTTSDCELHNASSSHRKYLRLVKEGKSVKERLPTCVPPTFIEQEKETRNTKKNLHI